MSDHLGLLLTALFLANLIILIVTSYNSWKFKTKINKSHSDEINRLHDELFQLREALYSVYYEVNPRYKDTFSESKLSPELIKKLQKVLFDEQSKSPDIV